MDDIAVVVITFIAGSGVGYYFRYLRALGKQASIEIELKEKLLAAEQKAQHITEKAESKAEKILTESKQEVKDREQELRHRATRLEKKEELLDERQITLDSERENVREKIEQVKMLKEALGKREGAIETRLEQLAGISHQEALDTLVAKVEHTHSADLANRLHKLSLQNDEVFEERARDILLAAMHRVGNSMPTNVMTSAIEIDNDEIKGKIIGKEGRNVRAFERATGVEVLVDETPGYIILSSFDPIRREIARVALEALIKDGRIQPAKIEELVEAARKDVSKTIRSMGEKATFEAGVTGLHPDLVTILGRLHFRTSYGQNVLAHSVEMAHIAATIAEEVGADVTTARAGALLHDIGKVASHEVSGSHVEIGIRILQKYHVGEEVILAMRAHHEEYPYETPESIIVQVADALSGARPGARRDSIENYVKRLSELEAIATDLVGVERAFAIAAGREIRVLVNPASLNDLETETLARTIAATIESKLRYPGEIKVHVIRETRVISYAR